MKCIPVRRGTAHPALPCLQNPGVLHGICRNTVIIRDRSQAAIRSTPTLIHRASVLEELKDEMANFRAAGGKKRTGGMIESKDRKEEGR